MGTNATMGTNRSTTMGMNIAEPGLEQLGSLLAIVLGTVAGLVILVMLVVALLTVLMIKRMKVVQQESVMQEHRYMMMYVLPLYVYIRFYL